MNVAEKRGHRLHRLLINELSSAGCFRRAPWRTAGCGAFVLSGYAAAYFALLSGPNMPLRALALVATKAIPLAREVVHPVPGLKPKPMPMYHLTCKVSGGGDFSNSIEVFNTGGAPTPKAITVTWSVGGSASASGSASFTNGIGAHSSVEIATGAVVSTLATCSVSI